MHSDLLAVRLCGREPRSEKIAKFSDFQAEISHDTTHGIGVYRIAAGNSQMCSLLLCLSDSASLVLDLLGGDLLSGGGIMVNMPA